MRQDVKDRIERHGKKLLRIFPRATEQDPIALCKKLRRLEAEGERIAVAYCNGDIQHDNYEERGGLLISRVNKLLGNVRNNQRKTGAKCGCRRGVERDNCPNCEGTGKVIDFDAIRNAPKLVPVFLNGDPRGYALKIRDEYVKANDLDIHRDWGGYGIIAPDLTESE